MYVFEAPAENFAGPGADFSAGPLKAFIAREMRSSVTRCLIKIDPVKSAGLTKWPGPGQLPLPPALRFWSTSCAWSNSKDLKIN